jgi:SAM-dependent methyltransferase
VNEASKTNLVRGPDFISKFFAGSVVDIGCGTDPVVAHARQFDVTHGDANHITEYLPLESFDTVHSSHCLEHMRNIPEALSQWWALVKSGGAMIIVVPEEDLYEQGIWPSLFNPDHKATFRLDRPTSWSPVSYDLRQLICGLDRVGNIDICVQDHGYDYALRRTGINSVGRAVHLLGRVRRGLQVRCGIPRFKAERLIEKCEWWCGRPIDQTVGNALAQIQAVVRKQAC